MYDTAALLQTAREALDTVHDPEIPVVTIGELGILRGVDARGDAADPLIEVTITPTYSGCPAMGQIADDIGTALRAAGIVRHTVRTVLAPAWTTDWITPAAREKLRDWGIAPPAAAAAMPAGTTQTLRWTPRADLAREPACPHCGSPATERLAESGSTACKALYRCRSCREPFDYFKPY